VTFNVGLGAFLCGFLNVVGMLSGCGKTILEEEGDNRLIPSSIFCSNVINFRLGQVLIPLFVGWLGCSELVVYAACLLTTSLFNWGRA